MTKDAKVQSNSETFVTDGTQTLVAPNRRSHQREIGLCRRILHTLKKGGGRSTQFVIAATLILGLTMLFVGNLVSERVQRSALQSAAEAGALYMEAFLEPYVQELISTTALSAKSTEALDRLMQSSSLKRHVASAKIWKPDGTVAYSTDKTVVHKSFPTNEIAGALKGHVVTALEDLDQEENSFERNLNIPLYEIYAPLRNSSTGAIVAVGEFYERADDLDKEINSVRRQVWTIVGTATLAMLILLFLIVSRADRIIQKQEIALRSRIIEQARLNRRNAALQRRIKKANNEFSKINELTLRRIGADLHDGPAQLLTLILIQLDDLADPFEGGTRSDDHKELYESIRGAAQDALREIRDISRGLALPEINDLSLFKVLALVAQRHEQRTGTSVELSSGRLPATAPLPLKICIYRFVQESLNNAYRHANGEGQSIVARHGNGLLTVQVKDGGPGIQSNAMAIATDGKARLGLAGLRYRVESLGGLFNIDSAPGQGTTVTAQFNL